MLYKVVENETLNRTEKRIMDSAGTQVNQKGPRTLQEFKLVCIACEEFTDAETEILMQNVALESEEDVVEFFAMLKHYRPELEKKIAAGFSTRERRISTQKGDRVKVIRPKMGHPDLEPMRNAVGTITDVVEPLPGDEEKRKRYEVTFDHPVGPRGHASFFPFFDDDLESL